MKRWSTVFLYGVSKTGCSFALLRRISRLCLIIGGGSGHFLERAVTTFDHVSLQEVAMPADGALKVLLVLVDRLEVLLETVGSLEFLLAQSTGVIRHGVGDLVLVEVLGAWEGFPTDGTFVGLPGNLPSLLILRRFLVLLDHFLLLLLDDFRTELSQLLLFRANNLLSVLQF
jgi:hypothetical protein